MSRRLVTIIAALVTLAAEGTAIAQVTYENRPDGFRYQVVTTPRQIAVTETRQQQITSYRQQVTTETVQHQQLYTVPVTQYQVVSRLNGRWNPFVTPYWTHHYEPVTTYQQQVATVNIPVSRVAWAPETRTVDQPVTTYRTANQINYIPIGLASDAAGSTAIAARPLSSAPQGSGGWQAATPAASQPSATIAARPSASSGPIGGQMMEKDPPEKASGWPSPAPNDSRYR